MVDVSNNVNNYVYSFFVKLGLTYHDGFCQFEINRWNRWMYVKEVIYTTNYKTRNTDILIN